MILGILNWGSDRIDGIVGFLIDGLLGNFSKIAALARASPSLHLSEVSAPSDSMRVEQDVPDSPWALAGRNLHASSVTVVSDV